MLDQQISSVMAQVSAKYPPPSQLLNMDRIRVATRNQMLQRIAIYVILGVCVATGLSSTGRALVQAAIQATIQATIRTIKGDEVYMNFRSVPSTAEQVEKHIHYYPDAESAQASLGSNAWSYNSVGIGEVKDMSHTNLHGTKHISILHGVAVAELANERINWSLPQYLSPSPDVKAVIHETFYPGSTTRVTTGTLMVQYDITYNGSAYHIIYSTDWFEKPHAIPKDLKVTEYPNHPLEEQSVVIKGHTATIFGRGWPTTWTLRAYYTYGSFKLSTDLPMDVLVDIAESLPIWE